MRELGQIMKQCTKCKQNKSISEFNKNKTQKDGLHYYCNECRRDYHKNHYKPHPRLGPKFDKAEYNRIYHQTHKIKIAKQNKKWREKHKIELAEYMKKYGETHRAEAIEYHRNYRKTIIGCLRQCFHHIKHRCNNPKRTNYKYYGGRGIKCLFENINDFIDYVINDLGYDTIEKLNGLEIDRINNDGNYERGNIRFVSHKVNCNNKRKKYNTS